MSDPALRAVTILDLHHDLARSQSLVRMVRNGEPEKAVALPVPFGCSLDDLQAEAEKAMRALSQDTAAIAVQRA